MLAITRSRRAQVSGVGIAIAVLAILGITGHITAAGGSGESGKARTVLAQVDTDSPPSAAGTRRALLIGVSKHLFNEEGFRGTRHRGKDPTFPRNLNGAANDVELIKLVLTRRFDFKPENIVTLTDSDATREAILAAMAQIVSESGPQDIVHIHFSGHGSYIKDASGEEKDKYDETILPYDARTDDVLDITDDEINAILAGLRARSTLVTFDSCHSGTATRGESDIMSRGGSPDPRTERYGDVSARGQDFGLGARVDASETVLAENERYVFMAGAAAEHLALDSTIDSDVFYGWFSWSLAKALSTVDQNTSAANVFWEIQQNMKSVKEKKGKDKVPKPMLEASNAARAKPLLAGEDLVDVAAGITRRTWVRADPMAEGSVVLRQGPLFGAVPESLWAIYPPDTTDFSGTPQVGTAVVKSRREEDSIADLEVTGTIEPGSRAVMIAPSWRMYKLRIRLDKMSDSDRKAFEDALRATQIGTKVLFVDAGEPSRYVVDKTGSSFRIFSSGKLKQIESFPFVDMASAADRAVEVFDRPIRATDLLSMDNPASSIRLELAVRPLDESGRPRVSNVAGTGPLPAYRILGEDAERTDWNSMIMEVSADRDVYVAILRIDPTGDLQVLFPNPVTRAVGFYPKGLIRANETVRIPSSLADDSNIAGFYLNAEPPLGRYELRAFAAADLKTAIRIWEYIGEYGIAQQELERDALYREEQRRQAAARHEGELASRGGAITPIGADWKPDWTAVTVSYVVED